MNVAPYIADGERFGKLSVLHKIDSDKRGPKYRVICDCGFRMYVKARQLRLGEVTSCRKCAAMHGTGHDGRLT